MLHLFPTRGRNSAKSTSSPPTPLSSLKILARRPTTGSDPITFPAMLAVELGFSMYAQTRALPAPVPFLLHMHEVVRKWADLVLNSLEEKEEVKEMEDRWERWDFGGWEGATAMIYCRESVGVWRGGEEEDDGLGSRPIGTIDGIMGVGLE